MEICVNNKGGERGSLWETRNIEFCDVDGTNAKYESYKPRTVHNFLTQTRQYDKRITLVQ